MAVAEKGGGGGDYAVQTLAQASKDTAEALRVMVDSTAKAIAAQTSAAMATVNDRLTLLERASYEGKGKEAVSDPLMNQLLEEVKSLRASRSAGEGRSGGLSAGWGYLVGGVGLVAAILGMLLR